MNNCFLPEIIKYNSEIEWEDYYNSLYEIFKRDFLDKNRKLTFNDKDVYIKKYPLEGNKEQAFFHITNKEEDSVDDRVPDFRRCERIEWVRLFIENYFCSKKCNCSGVHNWIEPFKENKMRTYIWCESKRFLVVLEDRNNYYLLITAFYVNENNHKKIEKLKYNYLQYQNTEIK